VGTLARRPEVSVSSFYSAYFAQTIANTHISPAYVGHPAGMLVRRGDPA